MKVLGREITLFKTKAAVPPMSVAGSAGALSPIRNTTTIMGFVAEAFSGAWQKNVKVDPDKNLLAFSAVYACITLIANDISKLRPRLLRSLVTGITEEVSDSPFLPVLLHPNHYQNRIQFLAAWIVSKLLYGNTYAIKERDLRGIVRALYVLDPRLVCPMVASSGDVYYQIGSDPLSLIDTPLAAVPASEIIHDRSNTLWHPLMGVSPIYACGASATQGVRIQANSAAFFENMSRPSGVLTAPGHIPDDTAARLKAAFEDNFAGSRIGRIAVLGDGLSYAQMSMSASDAQLIEQLKWTVEDVARCFHVPLHMLNSGPNPTYQNIGALTQAYYTQTLQHLIESMELCLTEGLSLPRDMEVCLDLEALLRMDTAGRYESYSKAIQAGWMEPNYARLKENLPPVPGGETPYLQQQNWSLAELSKRDINAAPPGGAGPGGGGAADPFAGPPAPEPTAPPEGTPPAAPPAEEVAEEISAALHPLVERVLEERLEFSLAQIHQGFQADLIRNEQSLNTALEVAAAERKSLDEKVSSMLGTLEQMLLEMPKAVPGEELILTEEEISAGGGVEELAKALALRFTEDMDEAVDE